jgi:ABC-type glycerol-3-phosphate transport system permease component
MGRRVRERIGWSLAHLVLAVGAALFLVPLVWLVATAFKSPEDMFHYSFFSPRPTLHNFHRLFTEVPFLRYIVNSFFVAGTTTIVQLFFASLGGFALAKYEFKGKRPIMLLMLATMMLPSQVLLAPLYQLIFRMRLVDTYAGLIIPGAVSVFGMFLFRQAMLAVPDELLDAARMDGCSEFSVYWKIVLPVCRPMVGAFCLIAFMGSWNSFLWPQILLHTQDRFTVPIALSQCVGLYENDYGLLMAGTLVSILPVAVFFFALQKEFVAGLTSGAVKG